jgi:hypothetical protein
MLRTIRNSSWELNVYNLILKKDNIDVVVKFNKTKSTCVIVPSMPYMYLNNIDFLFFT